MNIIDAKMIIFLIFALPIHKCFIASAYPEKPCSLFLLVLLRYSEISPERFRQSESLQRDRATPSEASYWKLLETPFHNFLQKIEAKFKGGAPGFLHRIC